MPSNRRTWIVAPACALVLVLACARAPTPSAAGPRPSDARDIRAVLDTTAAGWNRGALEVYMSAYADSMTSMGAAGPEWGREATAEMMRRGFWRTGRPLQQLRYDHVDVRPLGADFALVTGQFILTGGGLKDRTGWFTTVWTRTARGWRMIHDHSG